MGVMWLIDEVIVPPWTNRMGVETLAVHVVRWKRPHRGHFQPHAQTSYPGGRDHLIIYPTLECGITQKRAPKDYPKSQVGTYGRRCPLS